MKGFTIFISSILLAGCSLFGVGDYEEAQYVVLMEQDDIQIRQYKELLIAQTTTTGSYKESGSSGFKRLGGYIFGDNVVGENIEMTSPVVQQERSTEIAMTVPVFQEPQRQEQQSNEWTMTFVLPAKYNLDNIPKPIDETVEIKTQAAKKVATIRYSGFLNSKSIAKYSELLEAWLNQNGYEYTEPFYSAAYDPPWTLPPMRRNEVHVELVE